MSDQTGGMGAEVGVRKFNEDDEVVQEEGAADSVHRIAWVVLLTMTVLSTFGIWKIIELLPF